MDESRSAPRTTSVIPCSRVVDDDRELIREQAVGAPDDEVADVAREILALRALQPVVARPDFGVDAHAPRVPLAVATRWRQTPSRQVPG